MAKVLYLLEMGMNDNNITTDIKNHRVRVLENIAINYGGNSYSMFFEFTQGAHRNYRTTNKRTGAPLKKAVEEIIINDGLFVDTQFEKPERDADGREWFSSWRSSKLEREFWEEHHAYTRADILEVVNRYKVGAKFDRVLLVEEETKRIIDKVGGYRERAIIANRKFQTDGDYFLRVGQWDESHKVVEAIRREWIPTGTGRQLVETMSCAVDLVSGLIVG